MKQNLKMMQAALVAVGGAFAAAAAPIEIFVSPSGSDANPGTRESPVATPVGARDALRKVRAGGALPSGGAVVTFADGTYALSSPVELDARDGGAPGAPVVWRAANRGKAVFSGALVPTGWKPVDDPAILSLLPKSAKGKVVTATIPGDDPIPGFRGGGNGTPRKLQEIPPWLFQGESRLESARWPNAEFARTGEPLGPLKKRRDTFYTMSGEFKFPSDRFAKWAKEPELWAYGLWYHEWADAKVRVVSLDSKAGTISVDPAPIGFGIKKDAQFYVMNAISEIDRPGEWAIDRNSRRVYLWPAGRARPKFAFAPGLVVAKDVADFSLDGFVFEHARTDAVRFANTRRCSVLSSVFRHTSAWGVSAKVATECRIVGCDMYDLGEGGVSIKGGDLDKLVPGGNVVDNNHIHHYGCVVPSYRPGVRLLGVGNRCTHNLIHHSRHQGISFDGNDHYIGFNVCHDCCTFTLDAGAIYCCQRDWAKRGTVIEHNIIHMTGKPSRAVDTDAIFLDDFSSGLTVRYNIISRASKGVYVGGGQDCAVYGNVIMNCNEAGISLASRGIETLWRDKTSLGRESFVFKKLEAKRALYESPLWKSRYPNMMRVFEFPDARHAHDAHFNRITNNVCIASAPNKKDNWKFVSSTCVVENNIETGDDPGFEDYAHFGWKLKSGPARDLVGDLRFDEIGLYKSPLRVSPAVKFAADVTPPPPLRFEYPPAYARIDVSFSGDNFSGDLPGGPAEVATGCRDCVVPEWSHGKRITARFELDDSYDWGEYSFSFTPCLDATLLMQVMGARGEKTLYDDFRAEGAEIANGGFEGKGEWRTPPPNAKAAYAALCNLEKPWGVLTAAEAGCPVAEGRKMFCGNDMLRALQNVKVKKGVPVTITFKARRAPLR